MDALFACQAISGDAARLACLDREVTRLRGGTRSGDVIALDRKKAEVESFGLNRSIAPLPAPKSNGTQPAEALPSNARPANAASAESSSAASRVVRDRGGQVQGMENLAVASLDRTPYGQLIVTLQNGQLWVQTDRIQLFDARRKTGEQSTVSISSAALGSYQMQLNGDGPWFRVRRVN